jgi:hypothetical protein
MKPRNSEWSWRAKITSSKIVDKSVPGKCPETKKNCDDRILKKQWQSARAAKVPIMHVAPHCQNAACFPTDSLYSDTALFTHRTVYPFHESALICVCLLIVKTFHIQHSPTKDGNVRTCTVKLLTFCYRSGRVAGARGWADRFFVPRISSD